MCMLLTRTISTAPPHRCPNASTQPEHHRCEQGRDYFRAPLVVANLLRINRLRPKAPTAYNTASGTDVNEIPSLGQLHPRLPDIGNGDVVVPSVTRPGRIAVIARQRPIGSAAPAIQVRVVEPNPQVPQPRAHRSGDVGGDSASCRSRTNACSLGHRTDSCVRARGRASRYPGGADCKREDS